MKANEFISFDNPVFRAYVFCTAILSLKVLLMAPLTSFNRFKKKVFSNEEDRFFRENSVVRYDDEDIERVRRAHRNDLEIVSVYLIVAFLYVLTDPSIVIAVNLFRLFVLARICYTIVYVIYVTPQPTRFVIWAISYVIAIYMSLVVAFEFLVLV